MITTASTQLATTRERLLLLVVGLPCANCPYAYLLSLIAQQQPPSSLVQSKCTVISRLLFSLDLFGHVTQLTSTFPNERFLFFFDQIQSIYYLYPYDNIR